MGEIVRRQELGDITFGVPGDIEKLHVPFAFYDFIGVPRTATREEVEKAVKGKEREWHPDTKPEAEKPAYEEKFKALQQVKHVLLDDSEELGREHSRRVHYDFVCALDADFDGFIQVGNERTQKLSEIMLTRMEIGRKVAESEHELRSISPEYAELADKLGRARAPASKERILEQMVEAADKARGISPEVHEAKKKAFEEMLERTQRERKAFVERFGARPSTYLQHILDIFYIGDSLVTFGTDSRLQFGIAGYEEKEKILRLVLAGDCAISGVHKVHLKAPHANVHVTNPHMEGIVHVVEGKVSVEYDASSYGSVIRARAPEVEGYDGFERKGELFVPAQFATWSWWSRKPALDIVVKKGSVALTLKQREVAPMWSGAHGPTIEELIMGLSGFGRLGSDERENTLRNNDYISSEKYISGMYIKDKNIINENNFF